jgi:hypothetical protein
MKYALIIDGKIDTISFDPDLKWVEVPDDVYAGYTLIDGQWVAPAPATPTSDQINTERDRRVAGRFTFQGKEYDFDPASKQRVTGAATLAGFAIAQGSPVGYTLWHGGTSPFVWIAKDNTLSVMDAQICFAFGQAAAAHETLHIYAARQIKNMATVPLDYTNDTYWP